MGEENLENAMEIVSECCWEGDVEEAKRQRLKVCEIANIEMGQILMHTSRTSGASSSSSQQKPKTNDENASYSSLVGSAGF